MEGEFERWVCEDLNVEDVAAEHKRVALTGTLKSLDRAKGVATLHDATGSMLIKAEDGSLFEGLKKGDAVRAIGRPQESEPPQLLLETLHKLKDFDSDLLEKVRSAEHSTYF